MNRAELPIEKKQAINNYYRWMRQCRYADKPQAHPHPTPLFSAN
jgi:hypothetical protein